MGALHSHGRRTVHAVQIGPAPLPMHIPRIFRPSAVAAQTGHHSSGRRRLALDRWRPTLMLARGSGGMTASGETAPVERTADSTESREPLEKCTVRPGPFEIFAFAGQLT